MKVNEVIGEYESLLKRAISVLDGAPYFCSVNEPDYARLQFDGELVSVYWPEDCLEYDSSYIQSRVSDQFPVSLLLMPKEELKLWKRRESAKYDAEQKKIEARDREYSKVKAEQMERKLLAELKSKYEK